MDRMTLPASPATTRPDSSPDSSPELSGWAPSDRALLLCFVLASLAMVPAQIVRLLQEAPLPWLLADYGGRLLALAVIVLLPAGRWCLRQKGRLRVRRREALLWAFVIAAFFGASPFFGWLAASLPQTALGAYPQPVGGLYLFDLTLGLALVALHEELVFRKLARAALARLLRHELAVILASALIFAAYHWWTGIGNMAGAFCFGLAAMVCYRRTGVLWPVVVAHYLTDLLVFA
ncbi:MAG: CPBP family intramembrane metalloprotease [Rhodospirillaceae bacterium]|nr:CPBP family intramembrane metalloprotease [Rhodospirillaceae bacterium]